MVTFINDVSIQEWIKIISIFEDEFNVNDIYSADQDEEKNLFICFEVSLESKRSAPIQEFQKFSNKYKVSIIWVSMEFSGWYVGSFDITPE